MANTYSKEGVFSFARYDPYFASKTYGEKRPRLTKAAYQQTLLKRCCKVTVHEIMHLFGLDHCVWYSCCMQGSGHLEEDFRQPMHLCPIDLRKLQVCLAFEIIEQHQALLSYYKKHNLEEEYQWMETRLQKISDNPDTSSKEEIDEEDDEEEEVVIVTRSRSKRTKKL